MNNVNQPTELTPDQLAGVDPVRIYNATPGNNRIFEGMARIKKINQGDRQGVHAQVEFLKDKGETFPRWIFAKDQMADAEKKNYYLIIPADTHSKCKHPGNVHLSFCTSKRDVFIPEIVKHHIIENYTLLDAIKDHPEIIKFLDQNFPGCFPGYNVATVSYFSDRKVFDIIDVTPSGRTLTLRERKAINIKPPKMQPGGFAGVVTEPAEWKTEPDPNGAIRKARKRKSTGNIRLVGNPNWVELGVDNYFYDYEF